MKKTLKLLGIIAIIAVIGFSVVSCGDKDKDDTSSGNTITVEATSGQLTINNIPAKYNGKWVVAVSDIGNDIIAAAAFNNNETIKGGKVSGGSVTLKVWAVSETKASNYTGTETVEAEILVFSQESLNESNMEDSCIAYADVDVSFTAGKGTVSMTGVDFIEE